MNSKYFLSVLLILTAMVTLLTGASIGGVSDQAIRTRFGKKYKTCDKELQVRKFILCTTVDLYIDDWATSNLIAKAKANQGRGVTKIEDCCLDGCSDWSLLGFCLDEREQYTINNNIIDEGVASKKQVRRQTTML
jgi:hypothetical protein